MRTLCYGLRTDKIFRMPTMWTTFVSAEIPNAQQFPELHDVVTTHMMHGPCGENTSATCMKPSVSGERRCRFHFPFQPRETTLIPDNGREPLYRRRCQTTIIKKGRLMDYRWVASYNAFLLLRYLAHINVIVCTGSSPVKYLIKYIHKGADMSVVRAVAEDDEISQYEKSVYIGQIDSAWRLWSFPGHGQSPAVYWLNYHEPNMQPVNWPTGISDTDFRVRLEEAISPLLGWFRYNLAHPGGWQRRLLYPEFPEHYADAELGCTGRPF